MLDTRPPAWLANGMTDSTSTHPDEPHDANFAERLNWLRAGVLGANDGIVSVAATVVGVAGVTNDPAPILVAGMAAVVGGAVSMALGEYVSVSSQRDSQHALIEKERRELADDPEAELAELAGIYEAKGLSRGTAARVAEELTEHDALAAHLSAELNIDETEVVNPWHAAYASAAAFVVGAVLPMLAILLPPAEWRVPVTFVSVLVALGLAGMLGAYIGRSSKRVAAVRLIVGGALALAATYLVGTWLGASGIV